MLSRPATRQRELPLEDEISALAPWFHNLRLDGIETAPEHFLGDYPAFKWRSFNAALPSSLHGWTVLDIGCNAGFYSLEMKRRGARKVVGIDSDERYLRQAALAARVSGLEIELRQMSVYDVARLEERFDLVIFMGVLYHLRHPLLALDLIHEHVADHLMLFQTLQRGPEGEGPGAGDYPFTEAALFEDSGAPRLHFIENRFAGDPSNWWIPNPPCTQALLRSAGFRIDLRPAEDVYLCHKFERPPLYDSPPRLGGGA